MLTEHEIARTWRVIFRDTAIDENTFTRAEALLEELRPESPLRHRLAGELGELRKMRKQKPAAKKQAVQRASSG